MIEYLASQNGFITVSAGIDIIDWIIIDMVWLSKLNFFNLFTLLRLNRLLSTSPPLFAYILLFGVIMIRLAFEKEILGSVEKETVSLEEAGKIISGMLKSTNQLEVRDLAEITGQSENMWRRKIFGLIGDDTIQGEFDGEVLVMTEEADIGVFIDALIEDFEKADSQLKQKLD